MGIFVSYSRADNTIEQLTRLRDRLASDSDVYVDDLDWTTTGISRLESVYGNLLNASTFVFVASKNYRKTAWTAWEFDLATLFDIPKFAYMPDGKVIDENSDEWPFRHLCKKAD